MNRPYREDTQTDDQIIAGMLVNEIARLTDGANAMSQKTFHFPSGREPTSVEIESTFRRIERLRLMLAQRQDKLGTASTSEALVAIGEERYRRIVRDQEFYLECFVAETGAKPSEVIIVVRQDGPVSFVRAASSVQSEQERDAKLLQAVRRLCGYIENGSDMVVTICQDDATRDWILRVGSSPRLKSYYDSSFHAVIQKAADDNPPEV